ncbi:group 1 truncated hemoglobin [Plantactinospora siamensis]|uniref:Group 1 truncated hemoglobin n=1 Tax=Plantactinospora siamensis TaxID=555372 RepID=A0ABV6NZI1_9ACTN
MTDSNRNPADGAPAGSHFDRIGGAPALKTAVHRFYDRVLADPELATYFAGVDMQQQKRHMTLMLTTVLGGPDAYTGRSLPEAHKPLRIPVSHYNLVGEHLVATLDDLNVPADIVSDVQKVLAQVQDQVVADDQLAGA